MNPPAYRAAVPCITLLFLVLAALPAAAERVAPNGVLTPRRGPLAGQSCRYGDGSAKYTQIAEYTVAEIEAYVAGKKKAPLGSDMAWFLTCMEKRDYDWGSQLAREGYERYAELVKACLEDGEVNASKNACRHRAPRPIGVDIYTGKVVAEYMVDLTRGYWIVEPGWVK